MVWKGGAARLQAHEEVARLAERGRGGDAGHVEVLPVSQPVQRVGRVTLAQRVAQQFSREAGVRERRHARGRQRGRAARCGGCCAPEGVEPHVLVLLVILSSAAGQQPAVRLEVGHLRVGRRCQLCLLQDPRLLLLQLLLVLELLHVQQLIVQASVLLVRLLGAAGQAAAAGLRRTRPAGQRRLRRPAAAGRPRLRTQRG